MEEREREREREREYTVHTYMIYRETSYGNVVLHQATGLTASNNLLYNYTYPQ